MVNVVRIVVDNFVVERNILFRFIKTLLVFFVKRLTLEPSGDAYHAPFANSCFANHCSVCFQQLAGRVSIELLSVRISADASVILHDFGCTALGNACLAEHPRAANDATLVRLILSC
jgi:hypothetical protein